MRGAGYSPEVPSTTETSRAGAIMDRPNLVDRENYSSSCAPPQRGVLPAWSIVSDG
jgi:hypothetical protein